MRKTVLRAIAIAAVLSPAVAFTQSGKTKPTTATYITKEEVDTVNKNGQGIDRNIKVVDIGHENYAVGIIHRGKAVNGVAVPSGAAAANAAPAAGRAGGAAAPAPEPCGLRWRRLPLGARQGASLTIRRPKAITSSQAAERCSRTHRQWTAQPLTGPERSDMWRNGV